eukprot:CAMPEP_0119341614 /NCGR_PEP_ID=MMETSP1333-20130426/102814_1 /TAXON_ID=418940 /ORGANISM="Scyphosphaera apsteinii, Strain RCC1455" /LENGTH=33 /DNA_ID= /DNA_START= /DNA_END= /DNA_ORIENTATION=
MTAIKRMSWHEFLSLVGNLLSWAMRNPGGGVAE